MVIVPGEPFIRELNARGEAKYSDVKHVEVYISETVQDTASGTIDDYIVRPILLVLIPFKFNC